MKNTQPEKNLTPDEILAKLEYFCAYQERCPQEVRRKLTELGAEGAIAEQIYSVLENDGFFDEARFAEAYAGEIPGEPMGARAHSAGTPAARYFPGIIRQALENIEEETYLNTLQNLIAKKREQWPAANDYAAKAKTAAALIRAGYEPELVFRYL